MKLLNGRASRAEAYPDELCFKIIQGLIAQMERDGRMSAGQIGAVMSEEESIQCKTAFDDSTGEELDEKEVRKARQEEVSEIKKHTVYVKVPIEESWNTTNKAPIATRWHDINKGDKKNPEL